MAKTKAKSQELHAATDAWPYSGPGRDAVFVGLALPGASEALQSQVGPAGPNTVYAACIGANKDADPQWTACLFHLLNGQTSAQAWKNAQKGKGGLYNDPVFQDVDVDAALARALELGFKAPAPKPSNR